MKGGTGAEAIKVFTWLESFFDDVAALTREVDSAMNKEDFVSAYDNICVWDRSQTIQDGDRWLPRWMLRVYFDKAYRAQPPARQRSVTSTPYWGFFGVYFKPAQLQPAQAEPIAAWGVVRQSNVTEPVDRWPAAARAGIASGSPWFLLTPVVDEWQAIPSAELPPEFDLVEYRARPVVDLHDPKAVEDFVAKPLVLRLQELRRVMSTPPQL
jgi:hypothetical protein